MGALILAPIDLSKPLRVLDSGTADGTWIRDFSKSTVPVNHQIVGTGTDAAIFPTNPPVGHTYQVQDINKPWPEEWKESFDLVHQRLALVAGGSSQEQVLRNLAALVKPGGWIQLIETTNEIPEDIGPAFENFLSILRSVFTAVGSTVHLGNELSGWLKAAGFEDVQDRLLHTRLGATNPDPYLAKKGVDATMAGARGHFAFVKTLPSGTVPFTVEQIDRMPEELEAELATKGAVFPLRVVWGRKPAA
ncbi:S-adenosyl-L-methionine-dependent methyltransferase [Byssothecium circinans]|uniref:S-adenosyl-L-methionine-dependent methyltransferase n=1 Tax=Byssothecium circinans TaxID=147558 RepID=A0A6A5TEV3_9PLEO|nr:S-adenosyl-L-methionine-dependent methyltransferase [Byssothecium circinans]